MMLAPGMAIAVAAGTTIGFFFGGFPLVVVLRAASHLLFTTLGSIYYKKHEDVLKSPGKLRIYSLLVALIHSFGEIIVSMTFYFTGSMSSAYYQKGFVVSILLLVGLGTLIHSMVDFEIANAIMFALRKQKQRS
jgi:niacin transporter